MVKRLGFILNVGKEAWFQNLYASRNKFEKRSTSGACYRLHRLSREAGLLCLSWGDPCPGCLSTSSRAPKEAYLLTEPWWRARISSEMREGIATLQSLYERAGSSFSDGPSPRVSLVVLFDKAGNVGHQLSPRFPAIRRRRIATSPDEITRPTSLHLAVI